MTVTVIPVPGCMTPEEALAEIEILGYLPEQRWFWQRWWCVWRHGKRRWAVYEEVEA